MADETTRSDVIRNVGTRIAALLWAMVILFVLSPVILVIWVFWFVLHIVGMLVGNSWAFNNGPGFHLANNLFTWINSNIRVALWGNAGRAYVQWLPSRNYGGR